MVNTIFVKRATTVHRDRYGREVSMIDKSLSHSVKQPEHVHAHNHAVEKSKPLITMKTVTADWGAGGTKCDKNFCFVATSHLPNASCIFKYISVLQ